MLMTYFASSVPGLMILVQRATCRACSSCIICLSAARSHRLGGPSPVSDSLIPASSLTFLVAALMSSSAFLMSLVYGPTPCASIRPRATDRREHRQAPETTEACGMWLGWWKIGRGQGKGGAGEQRGRRARRTSGAQYRPHPAPGPASPRLLGRRQPWRSSLWAMIGGSSGGSAGTPSGS
jgi:hypothetical protein